MISHSSELLDLMRSGKHPFTYSITITLADETVLSLTEDDLTATGNRITQTQGTSGFPLGTAISKCLTLTFYNLEDQYYSYDFYGAVIEVTATAQLSETTEVIDLGTFTVTEPETYGTTITLTAFDNFYKADRTLTGVSYPTTIREIYITACQLSGLSPVNSSFTNNAYRVLTEPEEMSCRQALGYCAMIAGGIAVCEGNSVYIKTYDYSITSRLKSAYGGIFDSNTPYSTGDDWDGGSFNPWNTGDVFNASTFNALNNVVDVWDVFSQTASTDDVVITGIRIKNDNGTFLYGSEGYVLEVTNPLTLGNEQAAVTAMGILLNGIRFRPYNLTTMSYPLAELNDLIVIKYGNRTVGSFITDIEFNFKGKTTLKCTADSPIRNSSRSFTTETQAIKELRESLLVEHTAWTDAIEELSQAMEDTSGLYFTKQTATSGSIFYLHDKPNLSDSQIVFKMTSEGVAVSNNGGASWNAGVTVNGTVIANLLNANGVNANWIRTGSMSADRITSGTMSADRIFGGTLTLGGDTNGVLAVLNDNEEDIVAGDVEGIKTFNNGVIISFSEEIEGSTDLYSYSALRSGIIDLGYKTSGNDTLIANNPLKPYGKMQIYESETGEIALWEYPSFDIGSVKYSSSSLTVLRLGYYNGSSSNDLVECMAIQPINILEVYEQEIIEHYPPVYFKRDVGCKNNFYVEGYKARLIDTEDYDTRLHYCYETTSPYFGDIGTGQTDENGDCYVFLDDVLRETIDTNHEYCVFLQKEGEGDIWVSEKAQDYFKVSGTAYLPFSWELKAKQIGYSTERLEKYTVDNAEDIDYAGESAQLVEDYLNTGVL